MHKTMPNGEIQFRLTFAPFAVEFIKNIKSRWQLLRTCLKDFEDSMLVLNYFKFHKMRLTKKIIDAVLVKFLL